MTTTLYRAVFDEARFHTLNKRGVDDEQEWLTNTDHKVIFQHTEMLDRVQSRLLLLQDNNSYEWRGPWAPHSDFALNEEDAVQLLRWAVHPTSCDWSRPDVFGGKENTRLWKAMFTRKTAVCDAWLAEHGVANPFDPWWVKDGDNPATRRLMIP